MNVADDFRSSRCGGSEPQWAVACETLHHHRRHTALSGKIGQLLEAIEVLPLEDDSDRKYGEILAALENAGTPIGANDDLIAVHALSLGFTLVTENVGEFSGITGLKVENWLKTGSGEPEPRNRDVHFHGVNRPMTVLMERVENRILTIRGHRVMVDTDLAEVYGVPTKRPKEQVKRNADRFHEDFMFQLSREEADSLRSQTVTLMTVRGQHRKYLPPKIPRRRIGYWYTVSMQGLTLRNKSL